MGEVGPGDGGCEEADGGWDGSGGGIEGQGCLGGKGMGDGGAPVDEGAEDLVMVSVKIVLEGVFRNKGNKVWVLHSLAGAVLGLMQYLRRKGVPWED